MHGKELSFLALTFILISAVVVPTFTTDIASAQGSFVSCPTARGCDLCNDRDCVGCHNRDYDRSVAPGGCYRCNAGDYELSADRDYDRSVAPCSDNGRPVRDCGRCNVRDCVTCNY